MTLNIQEFALSIAKGFKLEPGLDQQARNGDSLSPLIQTRTRTSLCLTSNKAHSRWRQRR